MRELLHSLRAPRTPPRFAEATTMTFESWIAGLCAAAWCVAPLGCSGGDGGGRDAGVGADAALDAGEPGADAAMMTGEGDPCRFSIECRAGQLCVDDACVWHARVAPDDVVLGEPRWIGPADFLRSPFAVRGWDWETLRGLTASWTFPGPSGRQLVFLMRTAHQRVSDDNDCQFVVVNDTVTVVSIAGLHCHAAGVNPSGEMAAFGWERSAGRLVLVRLTRSGTETSREAVPESVDDSIRSARGPDAVPVMATSVRFDGEDVLVSVRLGVILDGMRQAPDLESGVAFLRFPGEGGVDLLEPGGSPVALPRGGWLVRSEGVSRALIPAPGGGLDMLDLGSGTRDALIADAAHGYHVRYFQVTDNRWIALDADNITGNTRALDLQGVDRTFDLRCEGCKGGNLQTANILGIPSSSVPVWLEHREVLFASPSLLWGGVPSIQFWTDAGELTASHEIPDYADVGINAHGFHAITRYGTTVEGMYGMYMSGPPFRWVEWSLRRR